MNEIICGDALASLRELPDGIVQTCVTSPPYFGLRDYGTETILQLEGDDRDCQHEWIHEGRNEDGVKVAQCELCNAVKYDHQIGLEDTPEAYIARLVEVFREVKRVLRDDGTCWINIGDSYSTGNSGRSGEGETRTVSSNLHASPDNPSLLAQRRVSVGSDLLNCLKGFIKDGVICLGTGYTLTVTSKSEDILSSNKFFPDDKFTRLLGIKRVFLKQRDNDLCQVLNLLTSECCLRISRAISFTRISQTDVEIMFDVSDHGSIIVSEHDLNNQPTLKIPIEPGSAEDTQMTFAVKEASHPVTESIRDIESGGNTITLDSTSKSLLQIDLIDNLITGSDNLTRGSECLCYFNIVKASKKHLSLSLLNGGIDLTFSSVRHLFISNQYGSLMRYTELYDKAQRKSNTLRAKQELGIPFMLRQALMEDGWICRSTIIWHKPNCMPESVEDRPTKAHEYIFLLSKSERYYYDQDSIREPHQTQDGLRGDGGSYQWHRNIGRADHFTHHEAGRNKRSVWTIATMPYSEAHFATFPPKLIEPCILAGSAPGDIVLDCFCGAGTVPLVALQHHRQYIGIELSPDYVKLINERIETVQPVLWEIPA